MGVEACQAGSVVQRSAGVPTEWELASAALKKISKGMNSGEVGTYNLTYRGPEFRTNATTVGELLQAAANGWEVKIEKVLPRSGYSLMNGSEVVAFLPEDRGTWRSTPPTESAKAMRLRALADAFAP